MVVAIRVVVPASRLAVGGGEIAELMAMESMRPRCEAGDMGFHQDGVAGVGEGDGTRHTFIAGSAFDDTDGLVEIGL